MASLLRIIKHRWTDEHAAARVLDAHALDRLENQVADSEKQHSGEIRLCVEGGLPLSYLWRNAPARERAITLFGKMRVWDTELNNGLLIYLLLADRSIEIVTDRALARLVPQSHWDNLLAQMTPLLREGRYEQALAQAVQAVDAEMTRHFPLTPTKPNDNELPNRAHLR